eukprot:37229-Eustigmatos_ZCMA.PRE.1
MALMNEFGIEPNNHYAPSPKSKPKKTKNDSSFGEFGELFSNKEATPILGKSRRELLTRIQQYKALFPDELKSFK